jgi:mannose-1-phosphate guanylyltransferase/mannose-6-phosphate isomerase
MPPPARNDRSKTAPHPGTGSLEIIEVQSGDYLGEDDIVRLEDVYGRLDT